MAGTQKDVYLVIGGSGFLGRHIVQQLLARGDNVSVFDIVQRYDDVPFFSGDISEKEQVAAVLRRCGTTCIIHTASPPHGLKDPSLYWKVNVDGTKAVIAAAQETGVTKLVYTSSAGVVFSGSDVIDCDERVPMPEKPFDVYNDSKAHGEAAVLAANGKEGLLTIALRPAGIFGPGDRQMMAGMYEVYQKGQTHFQIGDNNNLFDLTYVENAAYAHLLAADKLAQPPPAPPLSQVPEKDDYDMKNLPPLTDAEQEIIGYPLPPIQLTIKPRRVPTSAARPLGPYLTPPPNAEKLEAAFRASESQDGATSRPIVRTRFDAMSEYGVARSKLFNPDQSPLAVAGQAFFISNGEPIYFWDLARYIWYQLDTIFPGQRKEKKPFVLPTSIGMVAAQLLEVIGWITGRPAALTKFRVTFSVVNRWQNIEKARRVLGYEPQVSAEDGIKRMVQWFANEVASGSYKAAH
ncbi:C-3 sterol dehydrogenase [Hymenopellis radicata]|nr:C-3 sterol dehydrogenase [Hymenopellis radicata]